MRCLNGSISKRKCSRLSLIIIFVILMSLFSFPCAFSKKAAAQGIPGYQLNNYSTFLYNNSNGLPTSEANDIVQSENGYIFIGSYSGLTFYDGVSFERFSAQTGITSTVSLYLDKDDRLWIGTNDSGLVLYENGEYTYYGRNAGLMSMSVRSITQDDSGRIIFATTEGLYRVDEESQTVIPINDPVVDGRYLMQLTRCVDGVIYGITLEGVCFSIEDLKITHSVSSDELDIAMANCIAADPETKGKVWIGSDESEVVCGDIFNEMSGSKKYSVAPSVSINSIYPAEGGAFWICSDNGVGMFNVDGTYTTYPDFPLNNSVEKMIVDYEGSLWFVSSRQGVMKVVRSDFTNVSKIAGLDNRVVNTTCIYNGELYIGTDNGLILLDSEGKKKTTPLTEALEGVRIRCIKTSLTGDRLWLCTYSEKGLICYNGETGECEYFNRKNGLKSDKVRTLELLSDGSVVVTATGGVSFIKDGKIVNTLDESSGLGNTEILTICEGSDGLIYMGSDGGGIIVTDREKVLNRFGFDDGLKSEIILRLKRDPKNGAMWIITGNSIAYLENGSVRTISKFPYSNNFDMVFDNSDRMWILSSSGIYTVNREDMIADENLEYSFYDVNCGLPCVATANSYSCVAEDGELYIAGVSGVSSININTGESTAGGIKLSVPYIEVDDERIVIKDGETVTIPSDCKRLTFHAFAPTFQLTSPRFSYFLDGFDDEKLTFTKQEMQPISYTNLRSGNYTFKFSVVDTMTGKETETISVKLVKKKAFFEQMWFWCVVAGAALAGFMLFMIIIGKMKTRRLMKKEAENREFVNQIIKAFAKCIDLKDKYTNGHSFRVARYAEMIAEKMGFDEQRITDIYNIGLLHDIGKIAVPDKILGKPEKLTDEEFEIVSQHALNGYEILKEIVIRPELAVGAGFHHEHIDGTGYPFGKTGEDIPEIAQIIAVADTFDAMNSTRPYRQQMYAEVIIDEMLSVSGKQLNPDIVSAFLEIVREGKLDSVLVWENKNKKAKVYQAAENTGNAAPNDSK